MKERDLHSYTADLLRFTAAPGVLWLHIPNGEQRSARTGAKLKRMGVLAGAADFLVVVRGQAHFLELKTPKGRQSVAQLSFRTCATGAGSRYAIARSPEEVRNTLEGWAAVSVSPVVREAA